MHNLCFGTECNVSGYRIVKHPLYSIGPKLMFGSVSEHFANLQHEKDAKLASELECTILGYESYEPFILLHWTQNDVWECFRAFR
jgi:hypothetical protein